MPLKVAIISLGTRLVESVKAARTIEQKAFDVSVKVTLHELTHVFSALNEVVVLSRLRMLASPSPWMKIWFEAWCRRAICW